VRAFKSSQQSCENLSAGASQGHPTPSSKDIVMACKAQGEESAGKRASANSGGERVERGSLAMKGVTIGSVTSERRSSGGSSSTGGKAAKAPSPRRSSGGASASSASSGLCEVDRKAAVISNLSAYDA
jgi:hypothetical protein